MRRARLLFPIILMLGMIVSVIVLRSPYAPRVEPVREIEEIWAVEDARQESEGPLVTRLEYNGVPLAYEKNENTFYCSLGIENGEEWPEIRLTAPDSEDVSVCFVDDYAYDWCSDAIAEGYSYELMAYTDTEYYYFNIVFTGLPIVQIDTKEEIGIQETRCAVGVLTADGAAQGQALVHTRGAASSRFGGKKSYKIEFVRDMQGGGSVYLDVPLLGTEDDLLLLSCVMDDTLMRDKLSWTMYASLADEAQPFGARRCEYVELLVGGEYAGVYLMMSPVEYAQELAKQSASAPTRDSVYRTLHMLSIGERPYMGNLAQKESGYELFYSPTGQTDFTPLEMYMELEQIEEDKAFIEAALACLDLDSILRQYLFVQAGGLSDNVYNNMYIWAHQTAEGVKYRFAPWDMDLSWGCNKDPETGEVYFWTHGFAVAERLIALDAGGIVHEKFTALWRQMREDMFNVETVQVLISDFERQLNNSGAYMRNAVRWEKANDYADGYEIVEFANEWFMRLDDMFAAYGYESRKN